MQHLTPEERRGRLARLILRGAYLYARNQGWVAEEQPVVNSEKETPAASDSPAQPESLKPGIAD